MKPHLSEHQISGWIAGERIPEAERHVRECEQCAAEIDETQRTLALFRESLTLATSTARPAVGLVLLSKRWLTPVIALAAVAAAVVLAVKLYRVPEKHVQAKQEVFQRIPYVVPLAPYERATMMRMDVPVSALEAAGLRIRTPRADSVVADVVVGQDGRALAVGLPTESE